MNTRPATPQSALAVPVPITERPGCHEGILITGCQPCGCGRPRYIRLDEFDGAALVQRNGLPSAAFDALVQRVVGLGEEPWDANLMAPGDDPTERQATFGLMVPWMGS